MILLFISALLLAHSDGQYVKSGVKGGHGGYNFQHNAAESRLFGNNGQGFQNTLNHTANPINEVGVCYIEVPTASLVADPRHVPTGNGSRSDLSVIRSCCKGYIRNIYNQNLCDPVCSQELINALCVAPETYACFPDHVKNAAGICVATCPIGCQNGVCAGGECICKDGYTLDVDGKYCLPNCNRPCGFGGNCTGPNICTCQSGFVLSPDGNCRPASAYNCGACKNGQCVSQHVCRCLPGYALNNKAECVPECVQGCPNGECIAPNVCGASPTGSVNHGPTNTPNQFYPGHQGSSVHNNPGYAPVQNTTPFNPGYTQNETYPPYGQSTNPQPTYIVQPGQRPSYPTVENQHGYPSYNNVQLQNRNNTAQNPNSYTGQNFVPIQQNNSYPTPNQYYPGQRRDQNQQGNNFSGQTNNQYPQSLYPYPSVNQPQYPTTQPVYPLPPPNDTFLPFPNNYYYPSPFQPQGSHQTPQQNQSTNFGPNRNAAGQNLYPYPLYQSQYPGPLPMYPGQQPTINIPYVQDPFFGRPPNVDNLGFNNYPGYFNPNQPGYSNQGRQIDGSNLRVPVCSQACLNAVCTDGDNCVCTKGYVPDITDPTGSRCVPFCSGGCPNGVCTAPNQCICNMGYHKDTSVKGRAVCIKKIR